MDVGYIIPLNGLTAGKSTLLWKVGKEFFESFGNEEILDAAIEASVVVEKSGRYVGVDCDVTGKVTVECDRCLDELVMPVDTVIRLSVKYGSGESSEEHSEGEREVISVPETDADFDMSQIIYDYVCLALPMQRMHRPGECNPVVMRYFTASGGQGSLDGEETENPFAALKELLK